MVIDMRLRRACLALQCVVFWGGMLGSAHAQDTAQGKVWVVNGLHQDQITALGSPVGELDSRWLRLYRLTDPAPRGLECCLVFKAPTVKNIGALGVDSASVPLATRGAISQPFVGIALSDGDAMVLRTGPQSVEVLAKGRASFARVRHCVSQEGMRIDVEQNSESRTVYVPLGMDIEVPKKYRCKPQQ